MTPATSTALPNVVMEALASATPLVATTAGGIGTVVQDGTTGMLVAERDVPALAWAIGRILDDRAFGERLGAAARAWATTDATLGTRGGAVRRGLRRGRRLARGSILTPCCSSVAHGAIEGGRRAR